MKIAVVGAGNILVMPPLLATLASYFGERIVEIQLYDPDEERLDLMDRLARVLFLKVEATHHLEATDDLAGAIAEAKGILLAIDEHGCQWAVAHPETKPRLGDRRPSDWSMLDNPSDAEPRQDDEACELFQAHLRELIGDLPVIELQGSAITLPGSAKWSWPPIVPADQHATWPHQVLRWIRGDDSTQELLDANKNSPLRSWLDAKIAEIIS